MTGNYANKETVGRDGTGFAYICYLCKSSSNDLEFRLNHLLPVLGHIKAHELGTDVIKRYVARRQEEKASNASINREMAALKRMFNLGIQAEKIYRKPYVPMLAENNVRKGFF